MAATATLRREIGETVLANWSQEDRDEAQSFRTDDSAGAGDGGRAGSVDLEAYLEPLPELPNYGEILAREAWQTGARRIEMKLSLIVMTVALVLATVAGQGALI